MPLPISVSVPEGFVKFASKRSLCQGQVNNCPRVNRAFIKTVRSVVSLYLWLSKQFPISLFLRVKKNVLFKQCTHQCFLRCFLVEKIETGGDMKVVLRVGFVCRLHNVPGSSSLQR